MKSYTVVLSPEPDREWYSVSCPAMPGLTTQGENREDAIRMVIDAMRLWLEVAADANEAPLDETPELISAAVNFVLNWKAEEGWPLVVETVQVPVPVAVAA